MTLYERVIRILDDAIGGPTVGIGAHRTFWRNISRDQFVAKRVGTLGLPLLSRSGWAA